MVIARGLVFGGGALVVIATFGSAVRTVILPRGIPAKLGRVVFISMRSLFRLRIGRNATYERRDRVMAAYAPTSLLMLLVVWISLVLGGYSAMFWGLGGRSLRRAFTLSVRHPDPPALLILLQRQIAIVR